MFKLFDPKQEYAVRHGALPHWYQPGVTYFVTFRTEDSVPQNLVRLWHRERDEWLRRHGIDPARSDWRLHLSAEASREYDARFTRAFMESLDRGSGECVLRRPELAGVVANAMRHFDGEHYDLGDFVIMPNHVHAIVCLRGDTEIEHVCGSWKKFSAGEINRRLGRTGRFWQEESFDHLVRSSNQYEYLQHYIADNPTKANLRNGDFLYWKRPV